MVKQSGRCAVPSCFNPYPRLYDEHTEQYFCDIDCLTEYIAENPEQMADYYARLNIHEVEYE